MTQPAFVSKGTANNASVADSCTGITTLSPVLPATINASDIIVLAVNADVSAAGESVTSISETSLGGWTTLHENGGGTQRMVGLYYKVAAGTEDGATANVEVLFSSGGVGRRALAQTYVLSGSGSGLVKTDSGGASSGSSTSAALAALTAALDRTLGVAVVFTNANVTQSNATGETGYDWTEAAAEDTGGTTAGIGMQVVTMAAAGSVGGSPVVTLGSSTGWRTYVFRLEEKAPPASLPPRGPIVVQGAVQRAASW